MKVDYEKADFSFFSNMNEHNIFKKADILADYIRHLKEKKHFNYRRTSLTGSGSTISVRDHNNIEKEMIYLASNDYLNLTKHPKSIEAGINALMKYGSGAGSVPLLGGTLDIHVELEKKIAKFKGCENAIIYTSGFGSNSGSLLALLNKNDLAIMDMYSHASLIDGCINTNINFFLHNNLNSLEKTLKKNKDKYRLMLVIVDGVYSMDGDIAPLDKIVEISKSYNAYVMIDEAHATGVIGKNGRGTPEYFNIEGKVDIVAGTFSKALGVVGGFLATNNELTELLRFYSRSYMFSTAMTPQSTASIIAAIDIIENEPKLRQDLWANINYFKKNLIRLGFNIGNSETAIFPLIIGDDFKVKEFCKQLHDRNIYVNQVLYPAVPRRLSRIRMSLMSTHTKDQLDITLNALEDIGRKLNII